MDTPFFNREYENDSYCEHVLAVRNKNSDHEPPTVNDSPQPHASVTLGFLNVNFALYSEDVRAIVANALSSRRT